MMRLANRRDANEKEIIAALRAHGAYAHHSAIFDLMVAYKGIWYVCEVKDGSKPPSKQKLTEKEEKDIIEIDNRGKVHLVASIEDALEMIGVI
jgi:hypothetical protein